MPRYIDADWLLERAVPIGWSTPKYVSDIVIEDAPTADVVEVVRCKDCVNFKKVHVGYEEFYDCHLLRINCHSENDFCSRGEKR